MIISQTNENPNEYLSDSIPVISTNKNEKQKISLFSKIPLHLRITTVIALLSLVIHITCSLFPSFSDFFTRYVSSFFRTLTATITGIFPFSLAESILLLIPVLLIIYFSLSYKRYIKNNYPIRELVFGVLSLVLALYSFAVFTFLTGYSNSTLDKKLNIKKEDVSAIELYDTASIINEKLISLGSTMNFDDENFSVMPYSISEMSDKLIKAYEKICKEHKFLHNINAQIKPVALSEAMSYTHITGVYTFFTCEANIDAAFPDFTLPFTSAHEFAHQRGIARENEANFIAFLVCINSDDDYIKYSGYLNMLQYLQNALYSADRELYSKLYYQTTSSTKKELQAYSVFFNKYRDSSVSKVSGAINDTYLKLQGTEGTKSYGMVVDLAVAYYKTQKK